MSKARVWHQEEKSGGWTEYYLLLQDGEKTVSLILKQNAEKKEVRVEPYSPPDINYTIHDAYDHENDDCVLDDPDSFESQDVFMADKYARELAALERQVRERNIAERIIERGSA